MELHLTATHCDTMIRVGYKIDKKIIQIRKMLTWLVCKEL